MKTVVDPIFVRASHRYQSYSDFWRLVELSGFPIIEKPDLDFASDSTYIWAEMNAEFMVALQDNPKTKRRARTALWCLERPDARVSETMDAQDWWKAGLEEVFDLVDDLWVSDKNILAMDPRSTWVCFGGHRGLREAGPSSGSVYDVAHLGQRTLRRGAVILELERRGISVSPNAWGPERAWILSTSRLLLGIERLGGVHITTPLRWAVAAAYRLPIIQEEHPDPAPLIPGKSILTAPLDELADLVERSLSQDLSHLGDSAWRSFCEKHTFRAQVEEAVRRGVSSQKR